MPLPERVRKNAERAASLIQQNADARNGTTAAPVSAPPVAAPSPAPAAQPAPGPAAAETVESLQAKLSAANAEVERLTSGASVMGGRAKAAESKASKAAADLTSANARVQELEKQLQRKVEAGELNSLTEDDKRVAGKDLLQVIVKSAREVARQETESLMRPLQQRFDGFERMSEAQYDAMLDALLPDFEKQNNDPHFLAWLQGVDAATGRIRNQLLQDAHNQLQGYRTVEIFKAFKEKREIGALHPTSPIPPGAEGRMDPPQGVPTPPPPVDPNAGQKIISRADVTLFYREKREGKWRGKEAEAKVREQEIFDAQREGRVR